MNLTNSKIQTSKINVDKMIIYISLIMLTIIPILIYRNIIWGIGPYILKSTYDTAVKNDFFNYAKFQVLQFLSIFILILFMYRTYIKKIKLKNIGVNSYLLILTISVMVSSAISEYNYVALMGNSERFEGSLAWMYYIIIFFVLCNVNLEKKYYKLFYISLIAFLVINTILGILNLYDINILEMKGVYKLLGAKSKIHGSLITTLYNQNYSSGIGATIFIGNLVHLLLEKNKKYRMFILLMLAMSFSIILTSMSLSGFVTIMFISPIIVVLSVRFIGKMQALKLTYLVVIICSMIYIPLYNQDNGVYDESIGFFVRLINSVQLKEDNSISNNTSNNLTEELEESGNGRIAIWKETIKLINNKPILGYGLDTLPYVIDQDNHGLGDIIIDKPHNLYLNIIYGCGLLGFIGFIGIIIWVSKRVILKYNKTEYEKYLYIFYSMIISYAFQGLFNDSFIGTSILFWMILGIIVNILCKKDKKYIN